MSEFSHHLRFKDNIPKELLAGNEFKPFNGPVYLNGYSIHERLLEGVYFKCVLDEDGLGVTVSPKTSDLTYLSDLNLKKIIEEVAHYFEHTDIVSLNPNGSSTVDEEVSLWEKGAPLPNAAPPAVTLIVQKSKFPF